MSDYDMKMEADTLRERLRLMIERAEAAEDNLAKAVEGLGFYANRENWISHQPHEDAEIDNDEGDRARTTLAELEDKTDD